MTNEAEASSDPARAYVEGYKGQVPTSLDDRVGHEIIVVELEDGSQRKFSTLEDAKSEFPDVESYCSHSEPATGKWRSIQ